MEMLTGMIIGAATLAVSQLGATVAGIVLVKPVKQFFAWRRFTKEKLIHVGTLFSEIRQGGGDKPICGKSVVTSLKRGRIEVQVLQDSVEDLAKPYRERMFWTLAEFEAFDPVVRVPLNGS